MVIGNRGNGSTYFAMMQVCFTLAPLTLIEVVLPLQQSQIITFPYELV